MRKQKTILGKIIYIITIIILLVLLYFAYQYYQANNFNDFIRSEVNLYTSEFKRDNQEKYSNQRSYSIQSQQYNDAMFYKQIQVKQNQPYKITCMVKTSEVEAKDQISGVGAQISVEGTTERSTAITGTNDWQKIELLINSKNRETINIGFRLGGYLGEAKGQAWFSDFTIEEGIADTSSQWNFACFIFKTVDVNVNGKEVKLEMTQSDISDVQDTINRFESTCSEFSNNKMTANCDIYQIDVPLSKLSYDEEFAYYVAPEDVEPQIKDIIQTNNYDHIFVIVKLRRR